MVRFIHISDVHLGFEQYNQRERYKDFARAFDHAIRMGIDEKVDLFIIAGDLFNKKNIRASTLLQADAILMKAREAGIPVIVCEGNHDALSYGDSWSWLGYLARKDLIVLLGLPTKGSREENGDGEDGNDGSETTSPPSWDPVEREGTYWEHDFGGELVRIYGFGYLGAATKTRIGELSGSIIRDDAITIGILHAGVEGVIANMHGTIPEHSLKPFHDSLDYLALGHIHKQFAFENRVFNCGSLENWSLDETGEGNPHGLYFVEITKENGTPVVNARFVNGESWRRPFRVLPIDLVGISEQQEAQDRVVKALKGWGFHPVSPTPVPPPPTPHEPIENDATDERDRSELYMGTLDAFLKPESAPGESNAGGEGVEEAPAGEDDEVPVREDDMVPAGEEEQEEMALTNNERPVVIVRLRGEVGTKEKIELDPIERFIRGAFDPPALYLEVRDETTRKGFLIEEDSGSASREELERQVIRELLTQGEHGDHAEELHTLVFDLKEATLNRETGELSTFDGKIRDTARSIIGQEREQKVDAEEKEEEGPPGNEDTGMD